MKKPERWILFFAIVAVLLFAADTGKPAAQTSAPIVLKAVTAWERTDPVTDKYMEWVKRVNERAAGRLKIDYLGGPEVYPSFEQLDPLKRGVLDTIMTSTSYVAGALPELNVTWFGFGASPEQLRNSGLAEALDQVLREKAGVSLLGMPLQMRFHIWMTKPIDKADLKGLKLRSTPIYDPVLKGLGAATVTLPPAEMVPALQTGVVDGTAFPGVGVVKRGFGRVVKYKVNPPWWIGTDTALMNAQSWDRLPADMKKLLLDTMKEIERETPDYYASLAKEEETQLIKAGVKIIELPAAEVEKIKRIHWEEGTKAFLIGPSPKYGQKLKDLVARFAPR